MERVRPYCLLALFGLVSGSALANSSLTIDLPLVNGVPTLSGTPGQVVNLEATVTTDTALMITNVDVSQNTTEGDSVTVDPTVYLFDPNLGGTIPVGTTTGDFLGITFADVAPSISDINLTVQYQLSGDPNTYEFTLASPAFVVDTVEQIAPEPSSTALLGLGLCGAVILRRRQLLG